MSHSADARAALWTEPDADEEDVGQSEEAKRNEEEKNKRREIVENLKPGDCAPPHVSTGRSCAHDRRPRSVHESTAQPDVHASHGRQLHTPGLSRRPTARPRALLSPA